MEYRSNATIVCVLSCEMIQFKEAREEKGLFQVRRTVWCGVVWCVCVCVVWCGVSGCGVVLVDAVHVSDSSFGLQWVHHYAHQSFISGTF